MPKVISHGDVEVINNIKDYDGSYVEFMSYISSGVVYDKENNTVKWEVSSLKAGAQKTYIFYVKVRDCDSGTLIKNTATVNNKQTNETTNKVVKKSSKASS